MACAAVVCEGLEVIPTVGQVVGYARVSSTDQSLERQLVALGDVDRLFTDKVSGRTRADRVGLTQCLEYLREGDTLRVASMDRLARSLADLRTIVEELVAKGVTVVFLKESATYAPGGADARANLMLNILGAFAEFERAIIHERQAEGIAIAKAAGRYRGRAPKLTGEQVAKARTQIEAGVPKARIARELRVDRSTLYRALAG